MNENLDKFDISQLFMTFVETRDVEAMTLFYKKIASPCFRMALRYTRNEADAEDIVQLSFVKILENYHQYNYSEDKGDTHLLAWCFSIVINEAKMNYRSEKSRIKRESKTAETKMQTIEPNDHEKHDPKLLSLVAQELSLLPEKYKIPLSMKYIEGLKDSEIAIALRQNQNTTRSLIKRGIEKLYKKVNTSFAVPTALLFVLIKSQNLQAAPANLNTFIDQNMKSKLMAPSPTTFTPATTFSLAKTIAISASIIASIAIVPFVLDKKNVTESTLLATTPAPSKKTIDKVWKYQNEEERDFKVLRGQYQWDQNKKIIKAEYNKPLWIELPIAIESQPLQIDLRVRPTTHTNTIGKLSQTFFATSNNHILASKQAIGFSSAYTLTSYDLVTLNTYLIDNCFYTFYKETCIFVMKYDENIDDANISLLLRNYGINQISMKTIEDVPAFVKNEALKNKTRNWSQHQKHDINMLNISFDD